MCSKMFITLARVYRALFFVARSRGLWRQTRSMTGCAQLHIKIMRKFIINWAPFNHQGAEVTFRNLAHIHNYSLLQWCSGMVGRIHLCQNTQWSLHPSAVDNKCLLYSIINSIVHGVQWPFATSSECICSFRLMKQFLYIIWIKRAHCRILVFYCPLF